MGTDDETTDGHSGGSRLPALLRSPDAAMNLPSGLKVLMLPFDQETTDVLIGSYLSAEAAREDYRAALGCGAYLHCAFVVGKDLAGNVSVEQFDHLIREGAQGFGTLGFFAGLVTLPLLPVTTGVGAVIGGVLGEALHLVIHRQADEKAATMIPLGCAVLILGYPHSAASQVEPVVTRAVTKVVGQGRGHHVQALRSALASAQHEVAMTTGVT